MEDQFTETLDMLKSQALKFSMQDISIEEAFEVLKQGKEKIFQEKFGISPKFLIDIKQSSLSSEHQSNILQFVCKLGKLQSYLQSLTKDYIVLVRFYVPNIGAEAIHPGINSWGYLKRSLIANELEQLRQQKSTQPELHETLAAKITQLELQQANLTQELTIPLAQLKDLAIRHMYVGHDTTSTDAVTDSPFISATSDIARLLTADSPFNPDRTKGMIDKDAATVQPKKGGLLQQMQQKKINPLAAVMPTAARFVSDRIVTLIYGQPNEHIAKMAHEARIKKQAGEKDIANATSVATQIAFLLVKHKDVYLPPASTDPLACCMLEAEATIYAPAIDVSHWTIIAMPNELPSLANRFADI